MTEVRVEALIHQQDGTVQSRQQLPDPSFAEELLGIFGGNTAQLNEKSNEYERLLEHLMIAQDEAVKSSMKFKDCLQHYQILNNNRVKEFLDFAILLKARSESNETTNALLKSENDNLKCELETLKQHNLTLDYERKNLEYLSEKLCSLLLKYQQQTCQIEEIRETTTRRSFYDSKDGIIESDSDLVLRMSTSASEDSFDENNFSDTHDSNNESSISPPSGFRCGDFPVENIDPREYFSIKQEHHAETNTLEDTSNLSVRHKLRERVPRRSLNSFANQSTSWAIAVKDVPFQSDICDIEISHHLHTVPEPYDVNPTINNSQSTKVKITDVVILLEDCVIDSATHKLPTTLKRNENLASSMTSNVRCDICGQSFLGKRRKSHLNVHIREVHEGRKPYECTECGKRFARKRYLTLHASIHGSDKPFKCSVCNKYFKTSANERRHARVIHEGYAPFHCAHCDKRCSNKTILISHLFTKHFSGTQKPFKCAICGKSFAIKRRLMDHKLVHMSQRRFKCSICDQRYKYNRDKLRHARIIHGESNRFHCVHCEKVYSYKQHLSHHLQKVHM